VLDASELTSIENKQQIDRHDVAECILETTRPIAFDLRNELEMTGRVVIVDDFEIAGAGVILEALGDSDSAMAEQIRKREFSWERGLVTKEERVVRYKNEGRLIILHGEYGCGKRRVAKQLERTLYDRGHKTYYFGISNYFEELDHDVRTRDRAREEHLEKLGDLARVFVDEGTLLITTVTDADDYDLERLQMMCAPVDIFVVNIGENQFDSFPINVALTYRPEMDQAIQTIVDALKTKQIIR
jgi:bifunctional enzyme CysN/CysC